MDYSFIFDQIYNIILQNQFLLLGLVFLLILLIIFIVSRTFRKSGLFLLALTFIVDTSIKSLNFDLYSLLPILSQAISVLYIIGFINFFIRTLISLVRLSRRSSKDKKDSKLKSFFKFTGSGPFLIMLAVNVVDVNNYIDQSILKLLTNLSFLYMAFKSLYSTYLSLSEKEKHLIDDGMDFDEIKAYLNDDSKKNHNANRRIIKKTGDEDIKIYSSSEEKRQTDPISISKIRQKAENDKKIKSLKEDLSSTDMIRIIEDPKVKNSTTIRLSNLENGEVEEYTSYKCDFNLNLDKEYKIDLEFENFNDYDYGRFIDLLIKYSDNKALYKFELIVSKEDGGDFKIVFFDPSEIFDLKSKEDLAIGGRFISMNFPRYKINFIKGNC